MKARAVAIALLHAMAMSGPALAVIISSAGIDGVNSGGTSVRGAHGGITNLAASVYPVIPCNAMEYDFSLATGCNAVWYTQGVP